MEEWVEELRARLAGLLQNAVDKEEDFHVESDDVRAKDCDDQGTLQEASNEAAQPCQMHLLPPLCLAASQKKPTSAVPPGNDQGHSVAMLDAVLKNQEALRMVLTNQDMLKNLVDQLQKTMSAVEERVQAIEQEMGIVAQFTKEIDELADETNWG